MCVCVCVGIVGEGVFVGCGGRVVTQRGGVTCVNMLEEGCLC